MRIRFMPTMKRLLIGVLLISIASGSLLAPLPAGAQPALPPAPTPTTPPAPPPGLGGTGLQNDIQFDNCGGLIDPFICALGWILLTIANAVAWFSGVLLNLGVKLLRYMLYIDKGLFDDGGIVERGFQLTLQTANLFFILIVIVIAFMTILRVEQYGIKKLLPRLIIAVVLVNFSLVFAGAVLDFARVLGSAWIDQITPEAIGRTLQPQAIFSAKLDANNTGKFLGALLVILVSIAFIAIFTILAGIVILATAFMILIRYIWLIFLLILMPFAWLLWVTPYYTEYGKKWWDKFLQWALFLPVVLFFLYLAFKVREPEPQERIREVIDSNSLRANEGTLINNFFNIALDMVVTLGIMVGGLIAAQKMGIAAAGASMSVARSVASGLTGRKFGKFKAENIGKGFGTAMRKGISRVPLLRDVVRPLAPGITEDIRTRAAKKIVKRAEGPKIMEANPLETGTVQALQTGVGKMQTKFKEIFRAKGASEIVERSRKGESGFSESDIRKAAGSTWKRVGTSMGATGATAAAGAAGFVVGGPVGAVLGAGGAYLAGRRFVERQARNRMALAMLNAGKKDEPTILLPDAVKGYRKMQLEKKKLQKEAAAVDVARKYLGEQKREKENREYRERLAKDVHEIGEREREERGAGGASPASGVSPSEGGGHS